MVDQKSRSSERTNKDELENLFDRLISGQRQLQKSVLNPDSAVLLGKITSAERSEAGDEARFKARAMKITDAIKTSTREISSVVIETEETTRNKPSNNTCIHGTSEEKYLQKAADYVNSLPNGKLVTVDDIKVVAAKLKHSHKLTTTMTANDLTKLKKRYKFAIVQYIKKTSKKAEPQITLEDVEQMLQKCNGNLLGLYSELIEGAHVGLNDLTGIAGLCRAILNVLSEAELSSEASEHQPSL